MRRNIGVLAMISVIVSVMAATVAYADFTDVTTVMVTVIVPQPWNSIIYPDGMYELAGIYPKLVTLDNFTITVVNLTANNTDVLKCYVRESDGSTLLLQNPITSDIVNVTQNLTYTISSGDASGAYESSWYVENCSLYKGGSPHYTNNTSMPVFVKTDNWYFSVGGVLKSNDAANAYISWKSAVRAFFGHDDATEKDVLFAVYKYSGVHKFEGLCNNSVDDDSDGLTDCADPDCQTVFFSSCGHVLRPGGAGQFSPRTRMLTLPPPSSQCPNNICSMTVAGATVYWTQAANPAGKFKIYVERNIPSPEIVFVTMKNATSTYYNITDAGTSIYGPNPLPYKWLAPSGGPTFQTFIASSKPTPSSTQTFSGFLQMYMETNMTGAPQSEYTMNLDIYIGSPIENKNFSVFVDSAAPLNENESDPALPHNSSHYITGTQTTSDESCNDGMNNDLNDDGTDCRDSDCNNVAIGVTCGGDTISCQSPAENTCWDNFDNDGDGAVDCADSGCSGRIGGWLLTNGTVAKWNASAVPGAKIVMCDSPEGSGYYVPPNSSIVSSCADTFDNNANGATDCYDTNNCWGRAGNTTGLCPAFENAAYVWCADGQDNDFDKYVHAGVSAGYGTGADCDDYDCAGAPSCPTKEILTATGAYNASQCFDGKDNDLDMWYWNGAAYVRNTTNGKDCNDPDCMWAVDPVNNNSVCSGTEFNLARWGFYGYSYDYCDDGNDNDVDAGMPRGGADCADAYNSFNTSDTDCWQRFGGCGPCPSIENYTWNSCMNGINDDSDNGAGGYGSGGTDCADTDCNGELGSLASAQRCELGTEQTCNDSFDNNRNGPADCADSACAGKTGSNNVVCNAENTAGRCTDNGDNDGDGSIDCIDSGCWGIGGCAAAMSFGPLITVPAWTGMVLSPSGDIRADWTNAQYIGNNFTIRFQNVQSLSGASVVIVLGQWPVNNITFNVTAAQIVLSGPSAGSFSKDWTNGVLTLENTAAVSSMNLTVDILIPLDTAFGTETFPILTQSAHGQGNGNIGVTVYEHTYPVIDGLEVEPMWAPANVTIRVADSFTVRAIVNDTGRGGSQIAGCWFQLNGSTPSFSSNCVKQFALTAEGVYNVTAWPVDSPGNIGPAVTQMVDVYLTPRQSYFNDLNKLWVRGGLGSLRIASAFQTADGDNWDNNCIITISNDSGTVWQTNFTKTGSGPVANCTVDISVPQSVPPIDGIYYVTITETDSDGSTITSQRRIFYMCNSLGSSGPGWSCARADFDGDGATDGLRTDLWTQNFTQFCDNCPGIYNPNQTDSDLDGIGDVCDNCRYVQNINQADSNGNCPAAPYTNDPQCGDACQNVTFPPILPPQPPPPLPPPQPPPVAPEFTWPPMIIPPNQGIYTLPPDCASVLLEGEILEGRPTNGTMALILCPTKNFTAQIFNITKLDPFDIAPMLCNQTAVSAFEINVTADLVYYCMNYAGTVGLNESSLRVWKAIEGKWTPMPADVVWQQGTIICGNITAAEAHTPYMIAGFVNVTKVATSDEAMKAIRNANMTINFVRKLRLPLFQAESELKYAINAYLSCNWDKALASARRAYWYAIEALVAIALVILLIAIVIIYLSYRELKRRVKPKKKTQLAGRT